MLLPNADILKKNWLQKNVNLWYFGYYNIKCTKNVFPQVLAHDG